MTKDSSLMQNRNTHSKPTQYPQLLGMMVVVGVMATLGHLCMATALKTTDATIVAPVDYTRMLWAAGVGYLVFGEFPDLWTWVGGTVIFLSTVYITYRESRRSVTLPSPTAEI